jgi:hypothetical protein
MADGGTLFGLVRDIGERRKASRVRDVLRDNDYFNKPQEAIEAVNAAGYLEPAVALRDDQTARAAAAAKLAQEQQAATLKTQGANQERYRGALIGVTQALKGERDKGGDLGVAIDSVAPALTRGFGMSPEEVAELKGQVVANPALLDQFEEMFADPSKAKFGVVPGGGAVMNQRTGEITGRNPGVPKVVQVKRGDGGTDVLVMDENGNFVQSGQSTPGVAPGTGTPTFTPSAGNGPSRGDRNGNPGNIKDSPWARKQPGYIGSDGTFAKFAPGAGVTAQENLLKNHYVNGQRNVNDIVNKYLGGTGNAENSPESQRNYKAYVAQRLGIPADQPVPAALTSQLGQAMREFETGIRVVGTGPAPASGGSGAVYTTPGKPVVPDGWRDLSAEEKTQRGLDSGRAYQIGIGGANAGKVEQISGQARTPATGKAGKPAGVTMAAHNKAVNDLARLRDQARRIVGSPAFSQATGSIQGRLPSIFQGSVDFDADLDSYKGAVFINAVSAIKAASPNGASGFGSLTEGEGAKIQNSQGPINAASPKMLADTLRTHEKDAMVSIGMLYNIPPNATQLLIKNPAYSKAFDQKYGKGLARKILGR